MANLITASRFPLLIAIVCLLYAPTPGARLATVFMLVLIILLDSLDGVVARARHEESVLGSLLDIIADRSVELVMWVCFAHLHLVPVAIPVIYVLRGTIVDGLRNIHVGQGTAPFKTMRTRVGRWLVASPVMRTGYALAKVISFAGLALTHALSAYAQRGAADPATVQTLLVVFNVAAWVSVAFCLTRGIPVVVEALPSLTRATRTP